MKNTMIKISLLVLLVTLFLSPTAEAADLMNCKVTNGDNPTYAESEAGDAFAESLHEYLRSFNSTTTRYRYCRESITFSTSQIDIKQPIVLKQGDTMAFVMGNEDGDETEFIVDAFTGDSDGDGTDDADMPIITIDGSSGLKDVTIRNINISKSSDNHGAVIRCVNGATNVTLENVYFGNGQIHANEIDGCADFKVLNPNIPTMSSEIDGPFFQVTGNSDNFTFTGGGTTDAAASGDYNIIEAQGTLISIDNSDNYSISGLTASFADGAKTGPAIAISGSKGELDNIVLQDVTGDGIKLEDMEDGDQTSVGSLELYATSSNSGTGITLNNVNKLSLGAGTVVQYFNDGILIAGASANNTLSGIYATDNDQYGVHILETGDGSPELNTITGNSTIINNVVCGVYIASGLGNTVKDNNLYNNDYCGVNGTGFVQTLDDDDITVIARGTSEVMLDLNRDALSSQIERIEFHRILSSYSSDTTAPQTANMPAPTSSSTARTKKINTVLPVTNIKIKNGVSQSSWSGALWHSAVASLVRVFDTVAVVTGLYIEEALAYTYENSFLVNESIGSLPHDNIATGTDGYFFAMVYDSQDNVIGVWHGVAHTDSSESFDSSLPAGCYQDSYAGEDAQYRVYDAETDSDGDGLKDFEEDDNLNCEQDGNETTSADDYDTDNDGLDDGTEINSSHTAPNDPDSDNDSLYDGIENPNGDAVVDDGETDPNDADSDDDGLPDGVEIAQGTDPRAADSDGDGEDDDDDECPLAGADVECYYDNCAPGVIPAVPTDEDGDGIYSYLEDKDLDCQRDSDETDTNDNDTDGDGIQDGYENYDHDGVIGTEDGETDPLSDDSDADGITDGKEDTNGNGQFELSLYETDPLATDSDGDGIADGEEDYDYDGEVDKGETAPYLADTDGDNVDDGTDYCPWNMDQNCVVKYCTTSGIISGFENTDTDGDDLTDVEEDSNGDCQYSPSEKESSPLLSDTDGDGLTDDKEACFETNPSAADTDGDGKNDYDEVSNSLDQCTVLYQSSDTDPNYAQQFGGCGLVKNHATNGGNLPIIFMALVLALLAGARFSMTILKGKTYG